MNPKYTLLIALMMALTPLAGLSVQAQVAPLDAPEVTINVLPGGTVDAAAADFSGTVADQTNFHTAATDGSFYLQYDNAQVSLNQGKSGGHAVNLGNKAGAGLGYTGPVDAWADNLGLVYVPADPVVPAAGIEAFSVDILKTGPWSDLAHLYVQYDLDLNKDGARDGCIAAYLTYESEGILEDFYDADPGWYRLVVDADEPVYQAYLLTSKDSADLGVPRYYCGTQALSQVPMPLQPTLLAAGLAGFGTADVLGVHFQASEDGDRDGVGAPLLVDNLALAAAPAPLDQTDQGDGFVAATHFPGSAAEGEDGTVIQPDGDTFTIEADLYERVGETYVSATSGISSLIFQWLEETPGAGCGDYDKETDGVCYRSFQNPDHDGAGHYGWSVSVGDLPAGPGGVGNGFDVIVFYRSDAQDSGRTSHHFATTNALLATVTDPAGSQQVLAAADALEGPAQDQAQPFTPLFLVSSDVGPCIEGQVNCEALEEDDWYIVIKFGEGATEERHDDYAVYVGPGASFPLTPPDDYGTGDREDMFFFHDVSDEVDGLDPTSMDACGEIAALDDPTVTCEDDVLLIDFPDDENGNPYEIDQHTFGDGRGIVLDKFHILLPSVENAVTYALRSDIDGDGSPDYLELTPACDSNPTRSESNCQVQDDTDADDQESASEEAARTVDEKADEALDLTIEAINGLFDTVEELLDSLGSIDSDDDDVPDFFDNCPYDANPAPGPGPDPNMILAHPSTDEAHYWYNQPNADGDEGDAEGDACDDDIDNDGLTNSQEEGFETDPYSKDTDGDGLSDKVEVDGYAQAWPVTVHGVEATERGAAIPATVATTYYILSTDPLEEDADGDGLLDGAEFDAKSNPNLAGDSNGYHDGYDTDGDGLSDGEEDLNGDGAFAGNEPLPTDQDTDDDGLGDDEEIAGRLRAERAVYRTGQTARDGNPHAATFPVSDPTKLSTDSDSLSDGAEVIDGWGVTIEGVSNPPTVTQPVPPPGTGRLPTFTSASYADGTTQTFWVFSDPTKQNTDGTTETVNDDTEKTAGTDPTAADTDADGVLDHRDVDDLDADQDNDSYLDGVEDANGDGDCDNGETCADRVDSDLDGLHDFFEKEYDWTITVTTVSTTDGVEGTTTSRTVTSLAFTNKASTDGAEDGWNDGDEYKRGSDPESDDTDGDGLFDGAEWDGLVDEDTTPTYTFHWLDADQDNDRLSDGTGEDARGTDLDNPNTDDDDTNDADDTCPLTPNDGQADFNDDGSGDACTDTDADGLQDDAEDLDGDGEVGAGETDPALVDTDGDGFSDYEETYGVFRGDVIGDATTMPGPLPEDNPLVDYLEPSDPTDPASTPLTPTPAVIGFPSRETLDKDSDCRNPANWPFMEKCRDGMPDVPVEQIQALVDEIVAVGEATATAAAEDAQARADRTVTVSEEGDTTIGVAPTGPVSEDATPLVYVTLTAEKEVFIWRDDGDGQRGEGEEFNPCTGANCLTFFASLLGGVTQEVCDEVERDCALDDSDGDGYSDTDEDAAGSDWQDPASTPDDVDGDGRPKATDDDDNDPNVQDDADGDGVDDRVDNCPSVANPGQEDDGDGVGDACDPFPGDDTEWNDADADGVGDNSDVCPDSDDTVDADPADGTPDCYADDADGDGVDNVSDNCPATSNADQADTVNGGDGVGDACDDSDGDGLTDYEELNHVVVSGGTETDTNYAATDPTDADSDGDGLTDGEEIFGTWNPYDANGVEVGAPGAPTDPNDVNTDEDLLTDGQEIKDRADPTGCDPCDGGYGSDPRDDDSDDDGVKDNFRNTPNGDFDGDGYTNQQEKDAGSDHDRASSTPDNKDGDLLTDEEEEELGLGTEDETMLTDQSCEDAQVTTLETGTYLCRDTYGDYRLYVTGVGRVITIQDDRIVEQLDNIREQRDMM